MWATSPRGLSCQRRGHLMPRFALNPFNKSDFVAIDLTLKRRIRHQSAIPPRISGVDITPRLHLLNGFCLRDYRPIPPDWAFDPAGNGDDFKTAGSPRPRYF